MSKVQVKSRKSRVQGTEYQESQAQGASGSESLEIVVKRVEPQQATQDLSPWKRAIMFIIDCLKQKRSVWDAVEEVVKKSGVEDWSLIVMRTATLIDYVMVPRLKWKPMEELLGNDIEKLSGAELEKRLEEIEDMAYKRLAEVFENVVLPEVERIEKSLSGFPVMIYLATTDFNDIAVCVYLREYVDRQKFEEYRNIVKKLGLRFMEHYDLHNKSKRRIVACKQVFSLYQQL